MTVDKIRALTIMNHRTWRLIAVVLAIVIGGGICAFLAGQREKPADLLAAPNILNVPDTLK